MTTTENTLEETYTDWIFPVSNGRPLRLRARIVAEEQEQVLLGPRGNVPATVRTVLLRGENGEIAYQRLRHDGQCDVGAVWSNGVHGIERKQDQLIAAAKKALRLDPTLLTLTYEYVGSPPYVEALERKHGPDIMVGGILLAKSDRYQLYRLHGAVEHAVAYAVLRVDDKTYTLCADALAVYRVITPWYTTFNNQLPEPQQAEQTLLAAAAAVDDAFRWIAYRAINGDNPVQAAWDARCRELEEARARRLAEQQAQEERLRRESEERERIERERWEREEKERAVTVSEPEEYVPTPFDKARDILAGLVSDAYFGSDIERSDRYTIQQAIAAAAVYLAGTISNGSNY